jgi:uncharacterized membrane protein
LKGVEMELSPEERKRIYEEEKARIEAEQKIEEEKQEAEAVSTTNLAPNVAALLCYIGIWITGIIFLFLEQKSKFVRFHAIQSIIVFGVLLIANAILSQIPIVGWFFGIITGVLTFILWIVLMVKAYHGEIYKIPLAGDIAEKISGVSYPQDSERGEYAQQPSLPAPPSPPLERDSIRRVSGRTEDFIRTTKAGRITSSSFAIAWSFIFLLFFNFFNKYVAYYQYESGKWMGYPILTADFNAWLPIITATLTFSIIGHILAIIIDSYLLRETTLLVLNLFGLAAVVSLLSIFPFDFSVIPNTTIAEVLPIIATIALIGIAIGLGIAALVSFIRLIVSAATGTAHY